MAISCWLWKDKVNISELEHALQKIEAVLMKEKKKKMEKERWHKDSIL